MNQAEAISILEALASGCSPSTGEMLENDTILNERDVIRALQIAIDQLKNGPTRLSPEISVRQDHIDAAIDLFAENGRKPTSNSLTGFFLGIRKFKVDGILSHPLYGKYRDVYKKGQMLDYFSDYLKASHIVSNIDRKINPYRQIDYFQKKKFNRLSEAAINQLKERVAALGIQKTDNLSETIREARLRHPRAYESWTDKEKELLRRAIEYTNDLDLLSECFQRGKGAIESYGQKIIYKSGLKDE